MPLMNGSWEMLMRIKSVNWMINERTKIYRTIKESLRRMQKM
jgi:hypothetical protein